MLATWMLAHASILQERVATADVSSTRANAAEGVQVSDVASGTKGPDEASRDETSSLPIKTKTKFEPSYTFPNGKSRYTAQLEFEAILPYRGFFIPELEVDEFWSFARLRVSAESKQDDQGVASGLTDLNFTDVVARSFGALRAGVGFTTVFPMATDQALGQGKWQLGPAAGLELSVFRQLKLAVLVENFYSVAGSNKSPDLGYVTVQPFVTVYLPGACFVGSNATMDFYWDGGKTTVPVNLGVGHAFGASFVGSLQGWYTVAGDHQGDIKARAVLSFLR